MRWTALALLTVCVLVAAGCGGDDESSTTSAPEAWAQSFCTAVTTWTDELQTIGGDLRDPSNLNEDGLQEAASSVSSATDAFVDDIKALGAPDTESGEEIRDSVQSLADTVDDEKATIEQAAEDVSGVADLAGAVSTVGSALSAMASAFQSTLDTIENADADGELESAFESAEACSDLTS
jgi:gas vesicle protein